MAILSVEDLENGKIDITTVEDYVNLQAPTTNTRLSGPIPTLYGITADIRQSAEILMGELGYIPAVPFGAGIVVDQVNITVDYQGDTYAPIASAVPFTTTATFDPLQWKLISSVPLDTLADPSGSGLIGFSHVNTYPEGSVGLHAKSFLCVTDAPFNAVGDGVTDSAAAIQAAIDYARDNKLSVFIPDGTYILSVALVCYHNTRLKGASRHNTILKSQAGSNKHVIAGFNADALIAATTPDFQPDTGAYQVEITDLTVDGNRAGNLTAGVGIKIYGYGTKIRNVTIQNCRDQGLHTKFTDAAVSMEGTFENIVIDTVGKEGWWFEGPHDAHTINMMVIDASQNENNIYRGIYAASNYANGRFINIHVWHRASTTNRCGYAFSSGGGNEIIGSHLEGCRQQLEHRGSGDRVIGSLIYAPFTQFDGGALVVFAGNSNQHIGNRYSVDGVAPINVNTHGIQFGAAGVTVSNNLITDGQFSGFRTRSPINYLLSGGNYVLNCRGYASGGGQTVMAGTMHNEDELDYCQTGTYIRRNKMFVPPAFANNAAAITGGLQRGDTYINTTTNAYTLVV